MANQDPPPHTFTDGQFRDDGVIHIGDGKPWPSIAKFLCGGDTGSYVQESSMANCKVCIERDAALKAEGQKIEAEMNEDSQR